MEKNKNYNVELATYEDIEEIDELFNAVHDYLETHVNYPGWKRGVYPAREDAIGGVQKHNLFVLRVDGEIAGTIAFFHQPEPAYLPVKWQIDIDYSQVTVIHTVTVHPKFFKQGLAKLLMDFAKEYSINNNIKSIRLDVSEKNIPAIALYEKSGYKYIDTVDLGLNIPDLKWFKLYELVL
ncbi:GNAT family N-acetyltransferase [Paludicola sp. MB14-C6]|uniref:GNAT family N-acetyltransferase n=1 Tax=Paludihabitans sp. MB14-C6 TaxID=3070656 RepID=UPI0027DC1FE3|nr:GNAT family N-acetyltransferase [Paludicola sp. MB14-C6]WMJ22366.1 GNAT family N-acetyltransferase [Paludicola sp. MB14-C6]